MTPNPPRLEGLIADIIAHYRVSRRTFTEVEACGPLEDEGFDWRFALDYDDVMVEGAHAPGQRRFLMARDGDLLGPSEWYLASHTLANARLLERLERGDWDGQHLDAQLEWLDTQAPPTHHIFCEKDPRFECVAGRWHLAGEAKNEALPPAVRDGLNALWPGILEEWRTAPSPRTLAQLTRSFEAAGWSALPAQTRWRWVASWLEEGLWVQRVGADFWMLADAIPSAPARSRIAVLPQRDPKPAPELKAQFDALSPRDFETVPGSVPPLGVPALSVPIPAHNFPQASASWQVTLRTVHTLEGFVPVPAEARGAYPPQLRAESPLRVVEGQWFSTGEMLWLWLNRESHRFYGPDLKAQLEWCEVGTKLHLAWNGELIRISVVGFDSAIAQEESRLVDIEALAQLRKGKGESYRASIATLLEFGGQGLELPELVERLSQRVEHAVHVGTVRAILRAGGFAQKEGRWFLPHPDQSAANLRQGLTRALVESQNPAKNAELVEEVSLTETLLSLKKRLKELKPESKP